MLFGYVSTRSGESVKSFSQIAREGLSSDGGLYVPTFFPSIESETLKSWEKLSYADLALQIISRLAPEIEQVELKQVLRIAYGPDSFAGSEFAPLRVIDDRTYLLDLSTGPTYAFKDYAMQFVAAFLDLELTKSNSVMNIVGATSGDTGSAAIAAFMGKPRVKVFMLSPAEGMSDVQMAQMYGVDHPNIVNLAVEGVFDDCQNLVKAVNADSVFRNTFNLGAVNSINWARIAAQIVYYFWAYLRLPSKAAGPVAFSIPSGNFGNAYACYAAKRMGLPVGQIIVATNENDVLSEFINTSAYVPRIAEKIIHTSSPSMDIGRSSNIERLVYEFKDRRANQVKELWHQLDSGKQGFMLLNSEGQFRQEGIYAGSCNHQQRLGAMRAVFDGAGHIMDPHTAVAFKVGKDLQRHGYQLICVETAAAVKFPETVFEAIGALPEVPQNLRALLGKPRKVTAMPNSLDVLRRHIEVQALK